MIQEIPGPARAAIDVVAVSTSVSAVLGLLTQVFGLLGVILSCAWSAWRLYDYYQQRKAK